eukprot:UN02240
MSRFFFQTFKRIYFALTTRTFYAQVFKYLRIRLFYLNDYHHLFSVKLALLKHIDIE